jgi:CubicO group peptidase (beta-lactamase class C family)
VDGAGSPLAADTLFPVASITKLVTALAILRLADAGRLDFDDPLARHLPEAAAAQQGVTIRRLLSHTGGLRGDYPEALAPRAPGQTWDAIARAALTVPPAEPPMGRVEYSDLNYHLLGIIAERLTGLPIKAVFRDLVLDPLGIEGYIGTEPPRSPAFMAGWPADRFTGSGLEKYNSAHWRSIPLPNAGLITTVAGCLALVRAFHGDPAGFLAPATMAAATTDQTGGLAGGITGWFVGETCPWGLGPMLLGPCPWLPTTAGPRSFGHPGITTALAWLDPADGAAFALCSTRFGFDGWCDRAYSPLGDTILAALR